MSEPHTRPAQLIPSAPLRPGDTIGICAPSMAHAARYPRRRERALAHLRELGYQVRGSSNWLRDTGHTAGTAAERAADLHELYVDPEVRVIMTSIGGHNANQLLDLLDYDLIRAHPKPLVGYSDTSALLLAIWQRTRAGVVQGPQLLPQWGEYGGCHPDTLRSFRQTLGDEKPIGRMTFPTERVIEFLPWDEADDRPRERLVADAPRVHVQGRATGHLVAANLETLLSLAGTPYWPDLDGAILLLESTTTDLAPLTARLTQLRQMGVLNRLAGLGLGRFAAPDFDRSDDLAELIAQETAGFGGPLVTGLPIGHTDPMLCIPFGARATLATVDTACELTVLDSAVTA
ncbi:LD-carboxypeptidase [Streptomyces sp. NPDC094466]|uniref:S66 peptidase family protein n=1 Tax=Streptomyces sp. NPDC094466 TaxID=3366065 RepID=UPI00380F0A22